jgi:hypothetical protein
MQALPSIVQDEPLGQLVAADAFPVENRGVQRKRQLPGEQASYIPGAPARIEAGGPEPARAQMMAWSKFSSPNCGPDLAC